MIKITACMAFMIAFTIVANLLLKHGAMVPVSERMFFAVYGWKSVVGFLAFAYAGLIYAVILRWLPLIMAQSVGSLQFVAVILASAFILSESIPPMRWLGIAPITAGVLLVGSTLENGGYRQAQITIGARSDG